jgi:hypothetical protein
MWRSIHVLFKPVKPDFTPVELKCEAKVRVAMAAGLLEVPA